MAKAKKVEVLPLTVQSKVKEQIKTHGLNSAGDVIDAVNAKVSEMLNAGAERAKANGRKTVRGSDL